MTLEFLADGGKSLSLEEETVALRWYDVLRKDKKDHINAQSFLASCNSWLQKILDTNPSYFELSAVGSVVRGKREYEDIDFMLVSNLSLENLPRGDYPIRDEKYGLATEAKGKHRIFQTDKGVIEMYRELLQNYPDRDLWTVTPFDKSGSIYSPWTKIHLILQANVPSIEEWNSQDRFDKVPLLRKKTD